MAILRRWLLILSLMFWQGGFMFYGGVVVPVRSDVLGSDFEQGRITRQVTHYLNAAGAVALLAWAWDILATADPTRWWRQVRRIGWTFLAACLALLVWLHTQLDSHLDLEANRILDRPHFRALHIAYLVTSTAQWAVSVIVLFCTLQGWRSEATRRAKIAITSCQTLRYVPRDGTNSASVTCRSDK